MKTADHLSRSPHSAPGGFDGAEAHPADHFRPDLEGLRALAVALVLGAHLDVPWLAGGFVGVDVFFALSGFLITRLLLRELSTTGRIDCYAFYARRARRLLPASICMVVATALAMPLVVSPLALETFRLDGLAALFQCANYRFGFSALDYFAYRDVPSPFLHLWSLGVEEQFFLVWPVLLSATWSSVSPRRAGVALWVIAASSFGAALAGVGDPLTFYSLPTRMWELALGGLAVWPAAAVARDPRWISISPALAAAGLGAILAAATSLDEHVNWPGALTLLPTAGTVALLVAGELRNPVSGALALPAVRWMGRRSYSVYLFHWPVIVLVRAVMPPGEPLQPEVALLLVAVVVLIAAALDGLVADPLRAGTWIGTTPRRNVILAATVTLLAAGTVAAPFAWEPLPTTPTVAPSLTAEQATLPDGSVPLPEALAPSLTEATGDMGTGSTDLGGPPTMILLGDSHAAMWAPALVEIAVRTGGRVQSGALPACPLFESEYLFGPGFTSSECRSMRREFDARLTSDAVVVVALAGAHLTSSLRGQAGTARSDAIRAYFRTYAARLKELARRTSGVALIADSPVHRASVPHCLSLHPQDIRVCGTARSAALDDEYRQHERAAAAEAGVAYVDPVQWLCTGSSCPAVIGNVIVYRDTDHLTATFARAIAPRLAEALGVDLRVASERSR